MDKERFNNQFREAIDKLIEEMAGNSKISLQKFYGMTCFMENLVFLSPVLYAMVEEKGKKQPHVGDKEA